LRQRFRSPARLDTALHDRANAIHLDAIAQLGGSALEARLLAGRDDLRAWPLARRLRRCDDHTH
jgi:hypothetical protein